MPNRVDLPLAGPTFERALTLARQGVIEGILGGPGLEATLEPILTEAANDRVMGAVLTFLLIGLAAQAATVAADAELDHVTGDGRTVAEHAVDLVDQLSAGFRTPRP